MVLRGSSIAPPSLQDAETALSTARQELQLAKAQLESAQQNALSTLHPEFTSTLSRDELVSLVRKLQLELITIEQRELLAEITEEKAYSEVKQTLRQLLVGGAAGAIARTVVAPLDRVKILMQTSHLISSTVEAQNKSILGSVQNIVRNEGVMKLWRGNLTNCIRVVPHTATQFVAYDKYKKLILSLLGKDEHAEMNVPMRLTAGALSGMTAATVTHPMDVIRIRLQTQPELKGILDSIKSVYHENGIRTFYKGYVPAMLSLSPFIAINFATMDTLKKWYFGTEDRHLTKKEMRERNPFSILMLGAMSGIFAQTCCYPLDTIRRRMQLKNFNAETPMSSTSISSSSLESSEKSSIKVEKVSRVGYTGMFNAITRITREEGVKGFYKGMTANALKVVPNNAIRFAAFDVLKAVFVMENESVKNELREKEKIYKEKEIQLKALKAIK